jgi:Do/DeqQ family serine protease
MKKFLNLLLAAILGGAVTLTAYEFFLRPETAVQGISAPQGSLNQPPATLARYMTKLPTTLPDFTLVSEMTVNAVVHIRTRYERRNPVYDEFFSDPFRDFFFGPRQRPQQRQMEASGSGVIISEDGYIVTNNHVVAEADLIEVTLNDNRIYDAVIVGTDPTTDLALIRIEERGLPYLVFGDSDEVRIGEWVLAVGNPFNLTSTVTAGIVSAKGRNINILGGDTAIESFIQTDAAVNRGNSGGALVNTQGDLIGINAAIASTTGTFTGYSFAIPSNIASKVVEDLIEFGEVQRGMLGVTIRELNSREAEEKGLQRFRGAYVERVTEGGAADEAGIREGDIITGIDGQTIRNPSELLETLGRRRPGDEVTVKLYRDGRERDARATLKNIYGERSLVTREEVSAVENLGARFEAVPQTDLERLDIEQGVLVTGVVRGKLFANAGIRDGFIITHLDNEPVGSPQQLTQMIRDKSGGILIEGVYPNGRRGYYGIGIR